MAFDPAKVASYTARLSLPVYKKGAYDWDDAIIEAFNILDANVLLASGLDADLSAQFFSIRDVGWPLAPNDACSYNYAANRLAHNSSLQLLNYPYTYNVSGGQIRDIYANGSQLVAVGDAGNLVLSTDAVNWAAGNSQFGASSVLGVYYSANLALWVICGADGKIATSPDATTWTIQTNPLVGGIYQVLDIEGYAVAVGDGGACYSSDGITWTACSFGGSSPDLRAVATTVGAGRSYAVGLAGAMWYTTDAINWTFVSGLGSTDMYAAAGNGVDKMYVAGLGKLLEITSAGVISDISSPNIGNIVRLRYSGVYRKKLYGLLDDGRVVIRYLDVDPEDYIESYHSLGTSVTMAGLYHSADHGVTLVGANAGVIVSSYFMGS